MSAQINKFREYIWAMYDFADTIFSMNVVSLYFPLLIISDFKAEDIWVSGANSISQLVVVFLAPILGTLSDRKGKRMTQFIFLAILTTLGTMALSITSSANLLWATMAVFIVANIAYQLSLMFYNSILPRVCPSERWGKISGLGTALGYVGSIIGMALVMPFNTGNLFGIPVPISAGGRTATFLPTAVLFIIFALPTLIYFLRDERKIQYPVDNSTMHPLKKIWETLKDAKKFRGIRTFLLARLLFQEGVETSIIFMGVFSEKAMGMPDSAKIMFFIIATTAAVIGSFIIGILTDRFGAHRVLMSVLAGWTIGLSSLAMFPNPTIYWFAGAWLGIMLGGVWTASRPYLLHLAPPELTGRFFGLYSLSGKAAAVIGPLIWGIVALSMRSFGDLTAYRSAIASMAVLIVSGAIVLHKNRKYWSS